MKTGREALATMFKISKELGQPLYMTREQYEETASKLRRGVAELEEFGVQILDDYTGDAETILVCNYAGAPGTAVIYNGISFEVTEPSVPSITGLCTSCLRGIYWSKRSPNIRQKLCIGCAVTAQVREAVQPALDLVREEDELDRE